MLIYDIFNVLRTDNINIQVGDMLEEITDYLRTTHLYCIWCGYVFDGQ